MRFGFLIWKSVLVFMVIFFMGCSKSSIPLEDGYKRKQMRCCDLETNYVICKKCVDYVDTKNRKDEGNKRNKNDEKVNSKKNLKMKQIKHINNSWRV